MARRLVSTGQPEPARESARVSSVEPVKIPHDPVNEQILLLAARADMAAREKLVARLRPDAFLVREHVDLWLVMSELVRRKLDYDPDTVRQLSGGKVDPGYLDALAADRGGATVPANLEHHVTMLEWDKTRVDAVRGPIAHLLDALRDPTTDPERIKAISQQVTTSFERGTTSSLLRDPTALVRSAMRELRERRTQACYPYGLDGLDLHDDRQRWRMIPGAAPGKVTVVTGTPGSGKSALAARIALAQAAAGRRVLFGAWEPGDEDTLQLLAAMRLGWSRYLLSTTDGIDETAEEQLESTMADLATNIRFLGVPGAPLATGSHTARGERATNERALDQIHASIVDTGADVVIFDLWKRCLRQTDPDEEEQALVRQQAICAKTKCHGVLLQQQRLKDIEQRVDKRPTREGIKGSGAWVEIADTILGVHRPALWKPVDDVVLEIDVLKQRWGPWPMAIEFDWDSDKGSITGGATVTYDQPNAAPEMAQAGLDSFLTSSAKRGGKSGRKKADS
jgi:replicative DNA helicase